MTHAPTNARVGDGVAGGWGWGGVVMITLSTTYAQRGTRRAARSGLGWGWGGVGVTTQGVAAMHAEHLGLASKVCQERICKEYALGMKRLQTKTGREFCCPHSEA